MAMIKCNNCGNNISSETRTCPICGAYIQERISKISVLRKLLRYVFIVVSAIVLFSSAYIGLVYQFLYDYFPVDTFGLIDLFAREVVFYASIPFYIILYSILGLYLVLTEKK